VLPNFAAPAAHAAYALFLMPRTKTTGAAQNGRAAPVEENSRPVLLRTG
jgi:hypothetical protein